MIVYFSLNNLNKIYLKKYQISDFIQIFETFSGMKIELWFY